MNVKLAPLFLTSLFSLFLLSSISEANTVSTDISGYVKSLNRLTRTSDVTPEILDNPLAVNEKNENLFLSTQRARFKVRAVYKPNVNHRLVARIDYDHQLDVGSAVGEGDFRVGQFFHEKRQFLDLSQTLVEDEDAFYQHRFYRASVAYKHPYGSIEIGRKQIPWGKGRFFTPTDLFNPFDPVQIELDERQGVDAIDIVLKKIMGIKSQFVFTPRGKRLHPYRFLGRLSGDLREFEIGLIGGRVFKDHVVGFDFEGNVKDSVVRGEFLYREVEKEKDFIKFTVNADYNLPYNIYTLLEYHFNGEGRPDPARYERRRFIQGDIQQLAKNYLAWTVGYDITELLRVENRMILNLDDISTFIRPELQYEVTSDLLITTAAQIFAGAKQDEFGQPNNLYFAEAKYTF